MTTAIVEKSSKVDLKEGFYHFGMMPATNPVEWKIPSHIQEFGRPEVFETVKEFHPYDLWVNGRQGIKLYCTKAKYLDSVGVRGFVFPSISNGIDGSGVELSVTPYAGQVTWLRGDQVRAIIESCYKHFIRLVADRPFVWDMEHGKKPMAMSEAQFILQDGLTRCPEFDSFTDKYVADFVYIYRIEDAEKQINRNSAEYKMNPNLLHATIAPRINKAWFDIPVKSVAEMYPKA